MCATVPSIGFDARPPARTKVDSYPIQEKYGIVFAFLGDLPEAERPPLYEIDEYDQEGWTILRLAFALCVLPYPSTGEPAPEPNCRKYAVPDTEWQTRCPFRFGV